MSPRKQERRAQKLAVKISKLCTGEEVPVVMTAAVGLAVRAAFAAGLTREQFMAVARSGADGVLGLPNITTRDRNGQFTYFRAAADFFHRTAGDFKRAAEQLEPGHG